MRCIQFARRVLPASVALGASFGSSFLRQYTTGLLPITRGLAPDGVNLFAYSVSDDALTGVRSKHAKASRKLKVGKMPTPKQSGTKASKKTNIPVDQRSNSKKAKAVKKPAVKPKPKSPKIPAAMKKPTAVKKARAEKPKASKTPR